MVWSLAMLAASVVLAGMSLAYARHQAHEQRALVIQLLCEGVAIRYEQHYPGAAEFERRFNIILESYGERPCDPR